MTPEEHETIKKMSERVEKMNAYFFEPTAIGKPSRAMLLDDLIEQAEALRIIQAGRIKVARGVLWTLAFITTLGGAIATVKGWFIR